jgi:DNA-binding CsgD family transcriptional regulator
VGTGQDVTDLVLVLSPRESEMLMLLAEGLSGEEIAARLVLSPATVRTHIQNAMVKLGAHTRGQAIAKALRAQEIGS